MNPSRRGLLRESLPRKSFPLGAALLVGANAVPLAGVLFLGWDLFTIMFLYWAENGIIGLLNIPKILLASGANRGPDPLGGSTPGTESLAAKLARVPFFVLHYGLFWVVHGVFVSALFAPSGGPPQVLPASLAVGVLALFASHGASFLVNYVGRGEYLRVSPSAQMFQPYSRVVVLHATVVGGGLLTLLAGVPAAAIVILVAAKTTLDLRAHLREHRVAQQTP